MKAPFISAANAIRRMFERSISKAQVMTVLEAGDVIAEYEDDKPFPSRLKLGFAGARPIHVVESKDQENKICHVITVYEPDSNIWNDDYKTRRSK